MDEIKLLLKQDGPELTRTSCLINVQLLWLSRTGSSTNTSKKSSKRSSKSEDVTILLSCSVPLLWSLLQRRNPGFWWSCRVDMPSMFAVTTAFLLGSRHVLMYAALVALSRQPFSSCGTKQRQRLLTDTETDTVCPHSFTGLLDLFKQTFIH